MKTMTWGAAALVAALTLIPFGAARADKLSDFEAAEGKIGCDSIPYSDLRRTCEQQQKGVNDWCKGRKGPLTCRPIDTRALGKAFDAAKKRLRDAKGELSDLKRSKSRAKDSAAKREIDKAIRDKQKAVRAADRAADDAKGRVDDARKEIDEIIGRLETCIDHREAVMTVFARAKDKVAGEREAEVVPLARKLRDAYGESISGHRQAIDQKEDARDACRAGRRG